MRVQRQHERMGLASVLCGLAHRVCRRRAASLLRDCDGHLLHDRTPAGTLTLIGALPRLR